MDNSFFERPILNSPYDYPSKHWELDESGQPTHKTVDRRRSAEFITPIPKTQRQRSAVAEQAPLLFDEGKGLSSEDQQYDHMAVINGVREEVDRWRALPDPAQWQVTPETVRLLQHWRSDSFSGIRPFFCQVEAVETAIWLSEVAPRAGKAGSKFVEHLKKANEAASSDPLARLALKLATGAGKTTVMAMIIAWQTINAVRHPQSKRFTRGFLLVAPGITIRDRLRVLLPNDPESYYRSRELVPQDMLAELDKAKIVITNYHSFRLKEKVELSKGGRSLLQGRGEELQTEETEGQMMQRVMPDLMGMKNIMVINDEAHHCYREKPELSKYDNLKGDEKKQAKENAEAARLWISGLEAIKNRLGVLRVIDLSATPFFLSGSGYAEGTLFPWTMSDFSLMDAIECGIVKLPRVPVTDNIPGRDVPVYRNLWENISAGMPKHGRSKATVADPLALPPLLYTALEALYGHYAKTFDLWRQENIEVPPCFIVVCNNTTTSKLIYDYISGFDRELEDGRVQPETGRLELFRNTDEHGNALASPRTLLIDSKQLESGEALDANFRSMAAEEIEHFRRDIIERTGDARKAETITDQDLLREVMNTVGKEGKLGESIRCVVSVSMLTEGWDANNVTHVLGVRAFSTQLLCEQVIGRALRRQSYEINEQGLFDVEYADVLGIPFDFNAKPVVAPPQPPPVKLHVKAISPERDALEITFPRVVGYRVELPEERLTAEFDADSVLKLTPELVGPTKVRNSGIIGEENDLSVQHLEDMRTSTLVMRLTQRLLYTKWRDPGDEPELHLFGQLKRITRQWLNECLKCTGGTYPAQLLYQELADMVCVRITQGITRALQGESEIKAMMDPYTPSGSTSDVNFRVSMREHHVADERCSHVNYLILDSGWEGEFCRIAEAHSKVLAYVKNHNLGFSVPYRYGSTARTYIPDFIVLVDDGRGINDPLHIVVEIKGYRGEDAKDKKSTMETYWVPGVNNNGQFGRWAFAEFTDVFEMQDDFEVVLQAHFDTMINGVISDTSSSTDAE